MASVVNGPIGMYRLKPYFDSSALIEIPTCMYRLRSYHESNDTIGKVDDDVHPAVFELEKRQEAILKRLEELKTEVTRLSCDGSANVSQFTAGGSLTASCLQTARKSDEVVQDIVINADPRHPPLSLLVLYKLLIQQYQVLAACHIHSLAPPVDARLKQVFGSSRIPANRVDHHLAITLIWKDVNMVPTMMVSPNVQTAIHGEGNIARYLARLLEPPYDSGDIVMATEMDNFVDLADLMLCGNAKEKASVIRTLNSKLGKSSWLVGSALSLADIVMWSAMHQSQQVITAPGNVKKWLGACTGHPAFQLACSIL